MSGLDLVYIQNLERTLFNVFLFVLMIGCLLAFVIMMFQGYTQFLGSLFIIALAIESYSLDWLPIVVTIILSIPIMSYAAYKDSTHEHKCENKNSCFDCAHNRKYKKLLKTQLISYFIFLSILVMIISMEPYNDRCYKSFSEEAYCHTAKNINTLIAVIMFLAAAVSLRAHWILLKEAKSPEFRIESYIYE